MDDSDVLFIQMEDPFANVKEENNFDELTTDVMIQDFKIEPEIIINDSYNELYKNKVTREKDFPSKSTKFKKEKERKIYDQTKPVARQKPLNATENLENISEKSDYNRRKINEGKKQDVCTKMTNVKKENRETINKEERADKEIDKLLTKHVKNEVVDNDENKAKIITNLTFPLKTDDESLNNIDDIYSNEINGHSDTGDNCITDIEFKMDVKKVRKRRRKNVINHSQNEQLECCFCSKIYSQINRLKKHTVNVHNDEDKFQCDICHKKFEQYLFIARHMIKHSTRKPSCKYCDKTFYSSLTLKRHMNTHNTPLTFECDVCRKFFDHVSKLKKHMKCHYTPRTYPCDICQKPFQSAYLMKFHRIIHSGKREFKCDVCGKCFTQLPTLHRHKFLHISDSEKNFFCDVCAKKFPAAYLLKAHMLVHRPPSNCPHCEKSFLLPSGLKIHIKAMHSGENPYKCKICFKVFTQSSTMFRHMNLHNRSKEYTCDDCGKVFNVFYYLRKHIANVHSKAFGCDLCNKSFTKPHKLANHMARSHTFKPHLRISRKDIRECYICARGFNYNGLSRHVVRCKRQMQLVDNPKSDKQSEITVKEELNIPDEMVDPTQYRVLGTGQSLPLSLPLSIPSTIALPIPQTILPSMPQTIPPEMPLPPVAFTTDLNSSAPPTTIVNKYKCNICDISVSQSSTLTRHMKIHTRDIFKCAMCGTEFNRSEHLDKHNLDVHNPNKPYKCEICQRTFSHMPTLETHISIHSIQHPQS